MGGLVLGERGFVAGPSDMIDVASVLVVVAVHAQELPIAAVGWVVVVVMVAMVDGELSQILRVNSRAHRPQIHGYILSALAR